MTISFALYYDYADTQNPETLDFVRIYAKLTEDEVATFPKFLGFKAGNRQYTWKLKVDGVNGGSNEAALKKIRKLFDLGVTYGEQTSWKASNEVPEDVARKVAGL